MKAEACFVCFIMFSALAAEEIADRGKLLKKLQENLQSVFQGADLDFKIRRRANSALLDLLSTENIATVLKNDPAGRNLVERLHKGTDRIIDSLGIPRPVLSRIQSAVHNVFSSTVVDGICYKYFSANHTGCLRDDGTCVKLASGISESEKKEIVQEHNRVRRIVAIGGSLEGSDERGQPKKGFIAYQPKASRMREIRWDDELARLAQKWADRCPAVSDCVECRRVARFRVGQNLIVMNGSSTWTSVIAKWASHRSKFDHDWIYELPGFDFGPELASYAQLVSEGSYLIGCGQARFQASPKHPLYSVHVCNYGPGGLEPGDVVYLPGEPCSRCPQGHTCSENFLCSYQSSTAFIPQKLGQKCRWSCIDIFFLNLCDVETFQKDSVDCRSDQICCSMNADKLGTSLSTASAKPIASTSVKPATTIKHCANKCVRTSLISLCDADAIDLGITDCADEEVCCQLKRNLAQAFNPFTDAEPEGTTTTTTTSSMATPISCPHACFPVKFAETLCKPSSFLPNAICPDKDQVCCSIGIKPEAVEPPRPALTDCRNDATQICVIPEHVEIVCLPGSRDPTKKCPRENQVCCESDVNLVPTFASQPPVASTSTLKPNILPLFVPSGLPPCDRQNMQCMAKYLTSMCKDFLEPRDFTDAFSCSDSRLSCCAPVSMIQQRLLEIRIQTALPTSFYETEPCGLTAVDLDRVVDSKRGPLNEWCWAVSVIKEDGSVVCQAALIEKQFATAPASCRGKNRFIRIPWNGRNYTVDHFITRYDFHENTLDNDLSIVLLREPVELVADKACLICIRRSAEMPDSTDCYALEKTSKRLADSDLKMKAEGVDSAECVKTTTAGLNLPINSMCVKVAAPQDHRLCLKSGAPLFCKSGAISFLAGHLSFPTGCNSGGPFVFVNTYLPWMVTFISTTLETYRKFVTSKGAGNTSTSTGCSRILPLDHGSLSIICENQQPGSSCFQDGKYPVHTRAKYTCDVFYALRGPHFRVCQPDGSWSDQAPVCVPECGQRQLLTALSIGGDEARFGEWPWQIALVQRRDQVLKCGGALISKSWVTTAAHCVVKSLDPGWKTVHDAAVEPGELLVYLGKHYRLGGLLDDEFVQEKNVEKIVAHPSFSFENLDSDLAAVKLSSPAVLTARVQIICLPMQFDLSEANLEPGRVGTVTGWGLTDGDLEADQLNSVTLPIISTAQCRKETALVNMDTGLTKVLSGNMFCAGYGISTPKEDFQSVCSGDSGSPFVVQSQETSTWFLEGLVSFYFGQESCSKKRPGDFAVFTKMNRFSFWLEDTMSKD